MKNMNFEYNVLKLLEPDQNIGLFWTALTEFVI